MLFCIVGTGRCGTTLLKNILNLHEDVYVFNETHWILKMYEKFGLGQVSSNELLNVLSNSYHINGKPITEVSGIPINLKTLASNHETTVKDFCDLIGTSFVKSNGKKFWADKTPDYGPFMHNIQRLWPKCKFIHLIRHGADVSISMSKHPGYQWLASAQEDSWSTVTYNKYYKAVALKKPKLGEYAALWYRRLERIRDETELLSKGSYHDFRFEKLVSDPESFLFSLTKFVNISCSEKWMEKAVNLIDKERILRQVEKRRNDFMSPREICLLHELGYD